MIYCIYLSSLELMLSTGHLDILLVHVEVLSSFFLKYLRLFNLRVSTLTAKIKLSQKVPFLQNLIIGPTELTNFVHV